METQINLDKHLVLRKPKPNDLWKTRDMTLFNFEPHDRF